MKHGLLVGLAVAVGVFQHEDAVSLGTGVLLAAVVHHLADPDAAFGVDVDVGGAREERLRCEERGFKVVRESERFRSAARIDRTCWGGRDDAGRREGDEQDPHASRTTHDAYLQKATLQEQAWILSTLSSTLPLQSMASTPRRHSGNSGVLPCSQTNGGCHLFPSRACQKATAAGQSARVSAKIADAPHARAWCTA